MLKFGDTYLNFGGTYLKDWTASINPNPLNLPQYTIRVKYPDGVTPELKGDSAQVSQSPNIWDVTVRNTNWYMLFMRDSELLEVLGANTSGVTNMSRMFMECINLSSVAYFDTSNVTNMRTNV